MQPINARLVILATTGRRARVHAYCQCSACIGMRTLEGRLPVQGEACPSGCLSLGPAFQGVLDLQVASQEEQELATGCQGCKQACE